MVSLKDFISDGTNSTQANSPPSPDSDLTDSDLTIRPNNNHEQTEDFAPLQLGITKTETSTLSTMSTSTSIPGPTTMDTNISPSPGSSNISHRAYIYHMGPYPFQTTGPIPVPYSPQLHLSNPLKIPHPPSEPTSTLVLTSPRATFVDLRILKPLGTDAAELPNTGGPAGRVEWGFAGWSESEIVEEESDSDSDSDEINQNAVTDTDVNVEDVKTDESTPPVKKSTWHHLVSTRYPLTITPPLDTGIMYPLSPILTLEFGHAFNEFLQCETAYEEMWRDEDILAIPASTSPVAGSAAAAATKKCIVLKLVETDGKEARGTIVRLGQWCQGILRVGGEWVVERWEFEFESEVDGKGERQGMTTGSWKRRVKVGDLFLPCVVAMKEDGVGEGTRVGVEGGEWIVDEFVQWE